jgi:hypothetical protein
MSINVTYTDFSYNLITFKELDPSDGYFKHIFEDCDLRLTEYWAFSKVQNKVVQSGGFYYLTESENLNDVIASVKYNGENWTFYYNKITNGSGDTLWDYQTIFYGNFESKGKVVFDKKKREVATCIFSHDLNKYVGKTKMYYGDPNIFPPPYETAATFTFNYESNLNKPYEVVCEFGGDVDNNYCMPDFLARQDIMTKFPWHQHTYYHNFEPMLP